MARLPSAFLYRSDTITSPIREFEKINLTYLEGIKQAYQKFQAENPQLIEHGKQGYSVGLFTNGEYNIINDSEEGDIDEDDYGDNCLIIGLQDVNYRFNSWCQDLEIE